MPLEMRQVIRAYEERDHRAVRELFVRTNRELAPPHMKEAFEHYIALALREEIDRIPDYYDPARRRSFWVATDGDALLGNYGLEPADASFEIRRMYVDPAVRRSGIASAMLRHAEQVCRDAGASRIVLSTSELQRDALLFYRAAGFMLVREEIATTPTNKTVGGGLRRYYFEKRLELTDV